MNLEKNVCTILYNFENTVLLEKPINCKHKKQNQTILFLFGEVSISKKNKNNQKIICQT